MNITFIIGNGFDLNLGLETSYEKFYDYFIPKASEDNTIKNWIIDDHNIKLWSDYERRLGEKTTDLSRSDVAKFIKDKEEADTLLTTYISEQQARMTKEQIDSFQSSFLTSLLEFYVGYSERDKRKITSLFEAHNKESHKYSIIDFNYSNVVDRVFNTNQKTPFHTRKLGNVVYHDNAVELLHIHGSTKQGLITGVNDATQILNAELQDDPVFLDSFVKERMNQVVGQNNTNKAQRIINESDIIVVYGMSRGITDKLWWSCILNWCIKNPQCVLVLYIYVYGPEKDMLSRLVPSALVRKNNELFDELVINGFTTEADLEKCKDRIVLCYQNNIFGLKKS